VFFVEMGDITTACIWLASTIRMAQTLDIQLRVGHGESSEQGSRIWFTLYCWDRYDLVFPSHLLLVLTIQVASSGDWQFSHNQRWGLRH